MNIFKILIQIVGTLLPKNFTSLHFYKPVAGPLLLGPWLTKRSAECYFIYLFTYLAVKCRYLSIFYICEVCSIFISITITIYMYIYIYGIRVARRNINNLRYADDTNLLVENEETLKSLLMKVKGESEKLGLKLNIQKTKIMASAPITSWQIDGETVETVRDFIFLGSKITADGDYSREIQKCLLLGRKVMTNLDSILKSRDITLSTKVHLFKSMVLPVVIYGFESWTFTYGCES